MARRQVRALVLGVAAILAAAVPASADFKPAACVDTTPHKLRMVKVAPGVELEVIEWGGSGPAMVLLTGGGDNAHVYDGFAYQFTDHFRVIGITRRGYLPSSQPRDGYSVPRRAADDIAVLNALGIRKAVFVGHSAAGMELSRLGQAYPNRVEKLVYLDAADLSHRASPTRAEPPGPGYTDADLASLQAYQAAQARLQGIRPPEPSVCLRVKFNARGAITDATTPDWIPEKIDAGVRAMPLQDWSKIKAPRLGIYAPYTLEARQAWYWYLSPADKAKFDAAWPGIRDWYRVTIARFAAGNGANTHRLPGAPHYIYINNEAEVVRWMREFLGIPPRPRGRAE